DRGSAFAVTSARAESGRPAGTKLAEPESEPRGGFARAHSTPGHLQERRAGVTRAPHGGEGGAHASTGQVVHAVPSVLGGGSIRILEPPAWRARDLPDGIEGTADLPLLGRRCKAGEDRMTLAMSAEIDQSRLGQPPDAGAPEHAIRRSLGHR